MAKLWMGRIKVNNNCKVLEQTLKTDYLSNTLLKDFGGCSKFGDTYYYNYSDNNNNLINKFDINTIKMLLPPEVNKIRIGIIKNNLSVLGIKDIKEYKFIGYWINEAGEVMKEINTCIEFNSSLNDLMLDYFIKIMDNIKYEYKQEATALMVEDALILI